MYKFKNKNILLAPHSPMSLALQTKLIDNNSNIVGFIDKNKTGKNIFKIENIKNLDYDYIIILSPNHFDAIYIEYLQYIPKSNIYKVTIKNNTYTFTNTINTKKREISIYPQDINIPRTKFVFISKDFISSNNKALYIYCIKNNIDCTILTDNTIQIKELQQLNLPFSFLNENNAFMIITAMIKNFYNYFVSLVAGKFSGIEPTTRLKRFVFRFITVAGRWVHQDLQWVLKLFTERPYKLLST